jgi:hypothetical protein
MLKMLAVTALAAMMAVTPAMAETVLADQGATFVQMAAYPVTDDTLTIIDSKRVGSSIALAQQDARLLHNLDELIAIITKENGKRVMVLNCTYLNVTDSLAAIKKRTGLDDVLCISMTSAVEIAQGLARNSE